MSTNYDVLDNHGMIKAAELRSIVSNLDDLKYEYQVVRKIVHEKYTTEKLSQDDKDLKKAQQLAALFTTLYLNYLNCHREASNFRHAQREYEKLMQITLSAEISSDKQWTAFVRRVTGKNNQPRLLVVRLRRLLIVTESLLKDFVLCSFFIRKMDEYTSSIFTHQGWVWFLPRLLFDLALIMKHMICDINMSFVDRINVQLTYRARSLSNDIPWIIAGLVTGFVLTGSFLPLAAYLALAMQFYDLFVFGCLFPMIDRAKFHRLFESHNDDETFKAQLAERFAYDSSMHSTQFYTFCGLTLSTALLVPECLVFHPYMPIISAALMVLITYLTWSAQEKINQKIDKKYNVSFFSAKQLSESTVSASPELATRLTA